MQRCSPSVPPISCPQLALFYYHSRDFIMIKLQMKRAQFWFKGSVGSVCVGQSQVVYGLYYWIEHLEVSWENQSTSTNNVNKLIILLLLLLILICLLISVVFIFFSCRLFPSLLHTFCLLSLSSIPLFLFFFSPSTTRLLDKLKRKYLGRWMAELTVAAQVPGESIVLSP